MYAAKCSCRNVKGEKKSGGIYKKEQLPSERFTDSSLLWIEEVFTFVKIKKERKTLFSLKV